MKERPILFKAEMVNAILKGQKTQTRRIIKPQPSPDEPGTIYEFARNFMLRYEAGTHLWVRETWLFDGSDYLYKCTHDGELKWKPSIFMPRTASRITLKILNVRIERIQDITEEDAVAEGLSGWTEGKYPLTAKRRFAELWDSINLKRGYGWDSNPWVIVIQFKRILGM